VARLKLSELIGHLREMEKLEIENVTIDAEELSFQIQRALLVPPSQAQKGVTTALPSPLQKPRERFQFAPPVGEYKGEIVEVQLGATKEEGGSRKSVVRIGGQTTLYGYEKGCKNPPAVSFDVFDMPMPSFSQSLREEWQEVWEDPGAWAKRAVDLGADLITLHLISTDPGVQDTSPQEAAKTVEEVLQAVKVPLVLGGSGNPEKDPVLFEKIAAAAEGERCLLASANLDLDHKKVVDAANRYGHNVLSWTSMNITDQQMLNRLLLEEGLPKDHMVQDPTTGALGYGIDYTYSIIERMKQGALKGDELLQSPISCGVTNAWAAREAWMKEPAWGPREHRGPLWEMTTAITVLLAGADLLMMLHPAAVQTVKRIIRSMGGETETSRIRYEDWLTV
jgi:acetyl-CoA decarbonylase/synthase complex subunit delta